MLFRCNNRKPHACVTVNVKRSAPNPLRMDPSRTGALRQRISAELKVKFDRLKIDLLKLLVDDDAFGLNPRDPFVFNRFCPTGKGGGIDPTCGKESPAKTPSVNIPTPKNFLRRFGAKGKAMLGKAKVIYQKLEARYGKAGASAIFASGQAISWGAFIAGGAIGQVIYVPSAVAMVPGAAVAEVVRLVKKKRRKKQEVTANKLDKFEILRLAMEVLEELRQEWDRLDFLAANVFCPTGKGGGIDPTCSPDGSKASDKLDKTKTRKSKAKVIAAGLEQSDEELLQDRERLLRVQEESRTEFLKMTEDPHFFATPGPKRDRAFEHARTLEQAKLSVQSIDETLENRKRIKEVVEKGGLADGIEGVASIVGASDDARVSVSASKYLDSLNISAGNSYYSAHREAININGVKIMRNNSFFIYGGKGEGRGSQIFTDQVNALRELGYDRIETWAARGSGMNGYYTWPRLGYDQPISEFRDKRTRDRIKKAFPEAKSVLDVMETPEGRAWWKKNGANMRSARFDLKEGSRSLKVLAAYLSERAARSATASATANQEWPLFNAEDKPNKDDISPASLEEAEEIEVDEEGEPIISSGLTLNVFCPTGKGGGIDPTCSPGGEGSKGRDPSRVADALKAVDSAPESEDTPLRRMDWVEGESKPGMRIGTDLATPQVAARMRDIGSEAKESQFKKEMIDIGSPSLVATQADVNREMVKKKISGESPENPIKIIRQGGKDYIIDGHHTLVAQRLLGDGKTQALVMDLDKKAAKPGDKNKAEKIAQLQARIRSARGMGERVRLRQELRELTANVGLWELLDERAKMKAFKEWLRSRVKVHLTSDEDLWKRYAEEAWAKGMGRAYEEVHGKARSLISGDESNVAIFEGSKKAFLNLAFQQPQSIKKLQALASRSFNDLEGVTEQMSTAITRTLVDGLAQGKGPRIIGREMANQVDTLGRMRAATIARTEIVRAHAEGQLDGMEALGVEEIGVMVEWKTIGPRLSEKKGGPCSLCRPLEGVTLKIDEARGMLPRHPNCRCAWIPANVGEKADASQKRSKREIERAVKKSVKEASSGDSWKAGTIASRRPTRNASHEGDDMTSVLTPTLYLLSPYITSNVFCPTGEGGGIDPTCKKGEAGSGESGGAGKVDIRVDSSNPKLLATMSKVFKGEVDLQTLAAASNAAPGAKVSVRLTPSGSGVIVTSQNPGGYAIRTFYRDGEKIMCSNDSFVNKEIPGQPKISGADLLHTQVKALQKMGVDGIVTNAARNSLTNPPLVGYKVWPKLGYDGVMDDAQVAKLPAEIRAKLGEKKGFLGIGGQKGERRLSALYAIPGGKEAWETHGSSIDMTFDLKPGSDSIKRLEAYLAGRKPKT